MLRTLCKAHTEDLLQQPQGHQRLLSRGQESPAAVTFTAEPADFSSKTLPTQPTPLPSVPSPGFSPSMILGATCLSSHHKGELDKEQASIFLAQHDGYAW